MISRIALAAVGAALAAGLVAGCSPTVPPPVPSPSPTPTPLFATEEEAFAAAEEVYRAYVTATSLYASGNTDADPTQFTVGNAYEAELGFWRSYEQGDRRLVGESTIGSFNGVEAQIHPPTPRVTAEVCLDSTDVRVLDLAGNDVTPEGRENVSVLFVTFIFDGERFVISESIHGGPGEC